MMNKKLKWGILALPILQRKGNFRQCSTAYMLMFMLLPQGMGQGEGYSERLEFPIILRFLRRNTSR